MVLYTETYPGYGYQVQQSYTTIQDGYYSPNDRYRPVSAMPMGPTTHLMPVGSYAQLPGGSYDTNKHNQPGRQTTSTDYYNHGSNGKTSPYNNFSDGYKFPGGQFNHGMVTSGYGTHHGAHAPMGPDRVEPTRHEYSDWGNGRDRCPTNYHNPGGLQHGHQKVEWILKGVEDEE